MPRKRIYASFNTSMYHICFSSSEDGLWSKADMNPNSRAIIYWLAGLE